MIQKALNGSLDGGGGEKLLASGPYVSKRATRLGDRLLGDALPIDRLPPTRKPTHGHDLPAPNFGQRIASRGSGRRLLWIGDAVVPTGFATVAHSILKHLHPTWEVFVSGINYRGQPHGFPYAIAPAHHGDDIWGIDSFAELCDEVQPDVVVINNDWWNVARFLAKDVDVPLVGYMPVDGKNLAADRMRQLCKLDAAVWYTEFGKGQARAAGHRGRSFVVPHGVDSRLYRPMPKEAARRQLDLPLPLDAFVVGNVNRNQPRKRLDLSLQFFAEWIRENNIADAYLCLHCAQDDIGWDLRQLSEFFGVADRVVFSRPKDLRDSFPLRRMRSVYNALDVQISTTMGEGWGLTNMEGMACGIPQIVPCWAALAEWPRHVVQVACDQLFVHPELNTVGAIPNKDEFIAGLQRLYEDDRQRRRIGRLARRHVCHSRFQWRTIAGKFDKILRGSSRQDVVRPDTVRHESKRPHPASAH